MITAFVFSIFKSRVKKSSFVANHRCLSHRFPAPYQSYTEGQTSEQDKVVMLEAYFDEDLYEYSDFPFNFGIVELASTPSPSQLRGVVEGSLREVPEGGGGKTKFHIFLQSSFARTLSAF